MAKRKVKFVDLVNPYFLISIKFQFLEYVFKNKPKSVQMGWHRDGLDKLAYGYSANDYTSHTSIRDAEHLELIIYRILYSQNSHKEVLKFRDLLGLNAEYKFLEIDLENIELRFGRYSFYCILEKLKGSLLKKEFFHAEYLDRTDPKIISIKFTISQSGYHIFFDFTFKETLNSGWTKEFWSNGKSLPIFLNETFKSIDNMLVEPFIFIV